MYAAEIRRAVEAAPCVKLPEVAALMWRAYGDGHVSEAEVEALSGVIEARSVSPRSGENPPPASKAEFPGTTSGLTGSPRSRAGSRPRTDASMERRRRWAASGRLPPGLAAQFTLAEQAVLAIVAVEVAKRGDCRLALDHIAAVAGVSRATVRNAIRQAKVLGLVTVEERRLARFRNDTNIVCIVSREWTAWLRLARKGYATWPTPARGEGHHAPTFQGGGRKSVSGTNTHGSYPVNSEGRRPQKDCRGAEFGTSGRATLKAREVGRA